jgi:hypothetical protein
MHSSTERERRNGHATDDLPPANAEAERGLLASLLALPEALDRADVAAVQPHDLLDPAHRIIYRHLTAARLAGQTPEVLPSRIAAAGEYSDDIRSAIVTLAGCGASGSDAAHYADMVREAAEQRILWTFGRELARQIGSRLPPEDIHAYVKAFIERRPAKQIGARTMSAQLPTHRGLRPPVLHGLLREGETLNIIAPPKTGKSWLTYDLALCVVTGRRWLGTYLPVPGRVLILDNELHQETLCDRIPRVASAMGLEQSEWADALETITLRGRLKDIHRLAADELGHITPGYYRMIVIDALYRVLPPDCEENSNSSMAAVYNTIDALAARLQCAIVLVHHSTKGSQAGKAVTDVGSGAGSISRAADTHFVLRAHEEQGAVVADGVTRSWAPIEPYCLRWEWPLWRRDDTLDPALLRPDKPRRAKKTEAESGTDWQPPEQPWTAERFAAAYLSAEPALKDAIIDAACEAGLSERRATSLLRRAAARGLAQEWRQGRTVSYATVAQPVESAPDVIPVAAPAKRAAVVRALTDDPEASDREIAQDCGVSRRYVSRIRQEVAV